MLKHGILGLLGYGPMTGYEINEAFSNSIGFFWSAQKSQIYRELNTLEERGWISRQTVEQAGRPDKHVCSITSAGEAELLRWLDEDGTGMDLRSPLLMRVFFMGERPASANVAFFEQLLAECEANLAGLAMVDSIIDGMAQGISKPEHVTYWRMTLDYGKRFMQMHIDWARQCIDALGTS